MALYGISELAILLFLTLAVTVPLTLIVAAFGLNGRVRAHKAWRCSAVFLCCLVFVQVVALFNNRAIADGYNHAISAWYTHHLTRATVFDGMTFPPGSTVVLNEYAPHSVQGGTVPSNTPLLGLTVSGNFAVFRTDNKTSYLGWGTLAKPASFAGIECAPGPFTHNQERAPSEYVKFVDTVDCTLASGLRDRELDLPAATHVKALAVDGTVAVPISGELPRPWKVFGIECDAGPFEFDTFDRFTCILAVDQRVGGHELRRGEKTMVSREQDGSLKLFGRY
ncbi:hypothetical protein BLA50215_06047 [Burkholderia lata]|uniref:hypothetical protein n=1 Tax=Burkholderia lata (strain ATCC 17760 / DSM 23089 / LMG 22485 / NCIMB 9086 / R18194 / 383) TaxID=482957 RepID=UPI0014539553|nr:hypothetical protein [Burkholderia lata]VWD49772.1 hypothetical protein BLA50215_06047 [Burkholderia lata]